MGEFERGQLDAKKGNKRSVSRTRKILDDTFPTVVRYVGVILMAYAAFVDRGKNPALIPAATGMLLFKTLYGDGDRD